MEMQSNERNIPLKDLWELLLRRIWLMILVAIIVVVGLFSYNTLTFDPMYQSTATLYILRQNDNQVDDNVSADFSLALNVVNDCTYLLKSHAVLDEVMDELSLDISYQDLHDSISTSNPENTRILQVTVENSYPEQAKEIVDSLCKIGKGKIKAAMGFNQVNLYEYGTLETEPCNKTPLTTYIIIGLLAAFLVYVVCLVKFLLDDRIHSEEDIQHYLKLSVIGDIPNANDTKKHKYGYYAYRSKSTDNTSGQTNERSV